jgi:glycosyltransferase involved in cell wall biosynthesis
VRRHLLLVSYYYPPLGGSGVFRPLRWSKYLPRAGWDVTVLTVTDRVRVLHDPSLAGEVPDEVRVHRTLTAEPRLGLLALRKAGLGAVSRRLEPLFMLPDEQRGWVPFAVRAARRLLRERRVDAVATTAAPYSAHLVGLALRRAGGPPWLADFRDEWTTNPYLRDAYPTRWHRERNRAMERAVLRRADRVVCVSEPWLAALRNQVPTAAPQKFRVLENGYDGAHFPEPPPPPPRRFRIVYTGMFYGHRSPRAFLEALGRCLADGSIPRDEVEVLLVGHTGFTAELGDVPAEIVQVVEQRPYAEVVDLLREAAVLLLVIPRAGGPGNHTGKLFPYLAAGRPILALAPEPNVAAEIVRGSASGVVAPPDDPSAIARTLVQLYRDWKVGRPFEQDRAAVHQFEARVQARRLAALLGEMVAERKELG